MIKQFTATAFVQDSQGRVLLMWHKRLKAWMPPGGHVDENETPEETAKRECKEETGLDVEIIGDDQPDLFADAAYEGTMIAKPFAMLLENIPESTERGEPAHQHMDFLFRAQPAQEDATLVRAEQEADELRWFTIDEIRSLPENELFKNVRAYIEFMNRAK